MRVGLLVTCLVDLMRPRIGFAALTLLESAGCEVHVPLTQTCCGQPGWNSGDRASARALAEKLIEEFEPFDYVVAPSGSCAGMVKTHYPDLFRGEGAWLSRVEALAAKTWELSDFLVNVAHVESLPGDFEGVVTYHDSCAGLREMGVKAQPRKLLAGVEGLELVEMRGTDECCGFGGTFCVKYPEISTKMVDDKIAHIQGSGAGTVVGGDLGCLLNIAGRIKRRGLAIRVMHTAELLAGMGGRPAIGEPETR